MTTTTSTSTRNARSIASIKGAATSPSGVQAKNDLGSHWRLRRDRGPNGTPDSITLGSGGSNASSQMARKAGSGLSSRSTPRSRIVVRASRSGDHQRGRHPGRYRGCGSEARQCLPRPQDPSHPDAETHRHEHEDDRRSRFHPGWFPSQRLPGSNAVMYFYAHSLGLGKNLRFNLVADPAIVATIIHSLGNFPHAHIRPKASREIDHGSHRCYKSR